MKQNDISNEEKYEVYKAMMINLKKAVNLKFYYEVIFISYAIIEDRCNSILKYSGVQVPNGISKKLNILSKLIQDRDKNITKYLSEDLITNIDVWRNDRNSLVHSLANLKYDNVKLEDIALQGAELSKALSNKSISIRRNYVKNNYYDK